MSNITSNSSSLEDVFATWQDGAALNDSTAAQADSDLFNITLPLPSSTVTSVQIATIAMTLWTNYWLNSSLEDMDLNGTDLFVGGLSLNYALPQMILVAVVLVIVIIVTAFGNFLVGLALYKFKNLRTVSNYLIGNLAFSDFMLAITILPLSSVNECLGYWVFGEILCNFWLLADVLYCTASIWNLCIIALDRFTATLYPLWYREKRSTKQAGVYIAAVWLVSICITIPPLLGWNDISRTYSYDNATNVHQCLPFVERSFVLYSASGSFFVPFLITVFLYIRIFQVLRQRMKNMRQKNKSLQQKLSSHNTDHKTALLSKHKKKKDMNIELSQVNVETAAEQSSKSLVGSDSADKSDDDDEDDSAPARSDHPLVVSSSDAETPARTAQKNGIRKKNHKTSDLLVVSNPNHTFSGISTVKSGPMDHIQIVITTDDDGPCNKDIDSDASVTKPLRSGMDNAKTSKDNNNSSNYSERRRSLMGHLSNMRLKKVNPFKHRNKSSVNQSQKRRVDQREMRATIRMSIIIACFCGCWIGFFVCYVIHSWCPDCPIPRELDAFFFWLGYANSTMNPILYAIFNEEFRRAFQKLLGCYNGPNQGSSCLPSSTRPR